MQKSTIQLKDLTIGYTTGKQATPIVSHIHEQLNSGELTCLLGANGIGKSTLLKTISGFLPLIDGSVSILNKPIQEYTPKQLAKVVSIVLTQRPSVFNMTVEELVATGRTPYTDLWGSISQEDQEVIDKALEDIGITHLKHRFIDTLSDGEKQKSLIAKALAQDTPIILLDEPTAFLDYPSKVEVMQLLQELTHTHKKTILLSTHDMELAYQIADKIWLFNKERQLYAGTPEDLALEGRIDEFFNNTGLKFDWTTGFFKVKSNIKGTLQIIGESKARILLEKALGRIGFEHNETSTNKVTILQDQPLQISIDISNEKFKVTTIEELLQLLHHENVKQL